MRRPFFRGKLSRREEIERNNATDAFYAAAAGVAPRCQVPLPPKRAKVLRPVDKKPSVPLESAVNDDIYAVAKKLKQGPLWRNNRGLAQYGNHQVAYGVGPNGASDWIGYRRLFITTDMVGSFVAQFVAIEAKRPGEATREDQQRFIDRINADGGLAGAATSADEAEQLLTTWPSKAST